ncbi:MAG TPA: hypothetical protein VK912_13460, partial [Longimicrobiales bacterium]|nr:hypothetical protein [Longimicrobiales bacterium]
AADFRLTGAWVGNDALNAGDRNTVRVEFRGVTASGPRMNQYAHTAGTSGALPAHLQGDGNRLEFVGDAVTFAQINRDVAPSPGPGFFRSGRPER